MLFCFSKKIVCTSPQLWCYTFPLCPSKNSVTLRREYKKGVMTLQKLKLLVLCRWKLQHYLCGCAEKTKKLFLCACENSKHIVSVAEILKNFACGAEKSNQLLQHPVYNTLYNTLFYNTLYNTFVTTPRVVFITTRLTTPQKFTTRLLQHPLQHAKKGVTTPFTTP